MSLVKIQFENADGNTEKLDLSNLQPAADQPYSLARLFAVDAFQSKYFLAYVFGLVCYLIPPIRYIVTDKTSTFESFNQAALSISSLLHPLSILCITLFTVDHVDSASDSWTR